MRSRTSSVGITLGALIGLATVPLAIPSAALAQTETGMSSGAPAERAVHVVSCALDPTANVVNSADGVDTSAPLTISNIHVAFTNRAGATADSVAFAISYGGQQRVIVDKGHFSPGATIDHRFLAFGAEPFLSETPDSCTIASVHFEDGTVSALTP